MAYHLHSTTLCEPRNGFNSFLNFLFEERPSMLTIVFWAFMLLCCAVAPVVIGLRSFSEPVEAQYEANQASNQ